MTQTTIKRQISLLVKGILEANNIDDLKVEIELVCAFHRLAYEGKDVKDVVRIREETLASLLKGAASENELIEMEKRVKSAMGISVDGRSRYEEMLKFLVRKDKEGQKVEQYADWCKKNPFTAPKLFKIAERPAHLMETWEMAFAEKVDEIRPEYTKVANVEETNAVPNPYQKPSILRKKT